VLVSLATTWISIPPEPTPGVGAPARVLLSYLSRERFRPAHPIHGLYRQNPAGRHPNTGSSPSASDPVGVAGSGYPVHSGRVAALAENGILIYNNGRQIGGRSSRNRTDSSTTREKSLQAAVDLLTHGAPPTASCGLEPVLTVFASPTLLLGDCEPNAGERCRTTAKWRRQRDCTT